MAKRTVAIIALLLCLLPCRALAASTADAAENIDPQRDCVLTISCRYDGEAVAGVPVELYKVASVTSNFEYVAEPAFDEPWLELDNIQAQSQWNMVRSTLEAEIVSGSIEANHAAVTDQTGLAFFGGLKPGLYLAIAAPTAGYRFETALVFLPGLDESGFWQYQLTVTPKPSAEPKEEYKVLKLWKGDEGRKDRPKSVTVDIYRDGVIQDTVILSEENHWSYSWSAKDGAKWVVVERDVPKGYTMTVEERGTTFVLTNTRPHDPSDPPKTGDSAHLLLYVILMILSGSMLILLGVSGKRKRK